MKQFYDSILPGPNFRKVTLKVELLESLSNLLLESKHLKGEH